MPKITEKTLISKELADLIQKEVDLQLCNGVPWREAIKLGVQIATKKWKKNNANKRGG